MRMQEKEQQQKVFNEHASAKGLVYDGNVNTKEEWTGFSKIIGDIIKDKDQLANFLQSGPLHSFFFVNSQDLLLDNELFLLEKLFMKDELEGFLQESPIGNPPLLYSGKYDTTHNSVHHLYHLARYYKQHSTKIKEVKSVVEWGGGYGNMCKVFFNFSDNLTTYTIFDLPVCSLLQYIYLSSVFGKENVNLSTDGHIEENKINLLTFDKYDKDTRLTADMFLSTWALSESPIEYQKSVIDELNWFDCPQMLLAFHQCGNHIPFMEESTALGWEAKKAGSKILDVKVIPGVNHYAFR